jgi:polyhydroxybutyrate depolymerase
MNSSSASITNSRQDFLGSLEYQGMQRNYLVHLPTHYESTGSYPLVLAFHGGSGTPQGMARLTSFNSLADSEGFLVVYPEGYQKSWADGRGVTAADKAGVDDVGFISQLIMVLVQTDHADPTRVYAAGISNGGFFTQRLGCELSEKITAIGVVAATMPANTAPACSPSRPVPMVLMAGTDDPLNRFAGGNTPRGELLSAEAAAEKRAALNGCSLQPNVIQLPDLAPADGIRVELRRYSNCALSAGVDFYIIHGGGHTWPGGPQYLPAFLIGKTSREINATTVLWDFFQQYSLVH